ncbi:MAG: NADH:ubiquinone oxidoreductase [Myxococcota bacterium]
MFDALAVRASQGWQYIRDLRAARPVGYRGRPGITAAPCEDGCVACRDVCPTAAIAVAPVRLDLGRCVFCNGCAEVCPVDKIAFGPDPRMAARDPAGLVVGEGTAAAPVPVDDQLRALFGRSLRLRQISAGGCNGCELELNATSNVNFDLQRFGIEWVASPRHADGLVLTGPVTRNMARAVQLCIDATPAPKFVVAVGACAISGGLFREGADVERSVLDRWPPVVSVPGCPVHPLTFAHAILDLLGR